MTHTDHPSGPIALALTGASGAPYGLRLLECLLRAGRPVELMISDAGRTVLELEADLKLPERPAAARAAIADHLGVDPAGLRVWGRQDWLAPMASGSSAPATMVVCPCTTGTLAAIAHGSSDTLIERAADVTLKERKRLILVVRETPLSAIHLENMLRLARLGAVVLPASPGFYHRPRSVAEVVDFVVARVLDHAGVHHDLLPRWGGTAPDSAPPPEE